MRLKYKFFMIKIIKKLLTALLSNNNAKYHTVY